MNRLLVTVIICLSIASILAVRIDVYENLTLLNGPKDDASVIMRFLGEGRSLVSSFASYQADVYMHSGVYSNGEKKKKSSDNIMFLMADEINVTEHTHLEGEQLKEIIPWLYYAAEIDPSNVEAYTITGYFLCDRLGKVDEAINFMKEGLRKNPDSWEISAEIGRIYFQHVKNYVLAEQYLSKARKLLKKAPHDKFQERAVLSFLAYTCEELGQNTEARKLFTQLNELFPGGVFERKLIK